MSRYKSKYTGAQIDDSLTRVFESGIGSQAVFLSNGENLDTLWKAGFYAWDSNAVNTPFQDGSMIVFNKGGNYAVHQLVAGLDGTMVFRTAVNYVWSAWEYINPPMQLGVEYRTTERYLGKPVYTKAINFGALPNATTASVSDSFRATDIISVDGVVNGGSHFPLYSAHTSSVGRIDVFANIYGKIWVTTTTDWSGSTATIIIKYTKD